MATFDVTRDGATYRVTMPDAQADSMTPERILELIDGAAARPRLLTDEEVGVAQPHNRRRLLTDEEVGIARRPGQLRIEGVPNPVNVDPSFADLTPEQQARTVDEIRAEWDRQHRAGQDNPQPTGAGFSALQYGARQGARGLAATARVMGDALDNDWLRRQGRELDDAVPEPRGYVPSGPELVRAIREGRYGDAASNLPGAAVEALPGMGATMAAGAAAGAVGGPVAGLAAAGMTSAAQGFGQVAEDRAARDGVSPTDPGNMLAAAGTTAATAALDAVGARGVGRVVTAPRGLTARVGAAVRGGVREGVTEGAQDMVEQTGATLGTRGGWEVDPAQVAAAAATGAGAGGAVRLPGAVVRGTAETALDAATAGEFRHMSEAQAASVVRVNDVLDRERAAVLDRTGREPDPAYVLNTVRGDLATDLRMRVRQAEQAGWLDQDRQREGTALRELIAEAEHQQRELGSGIDRLDDLSRAPAEFRDGMRDLLSDLDVLSRASRPGNTGGLFERVGRVVGGASGLAAGVGAGPVGVAMSALAAAGGTTIGARAGASVGRSVDRALGGDALAVVQARRKAAAVLRKAGTDAGSTPERRAALRRLLTDDRLASRAALGLPTDADTVAKQAAEAAARRVAAREAVQRDDAETAQRHAEDAQAEAVAKAQRRVGKTPARQAAQYPVGESPEASAPSPVSPTGAAPEPAPVDSLDSPRGDVGPMGGGRRYVRSVLFSKGDTTPTSDADIHAAVDRLRARR